MSLAENEIRLVKLHAGSATDTIRCSLSVAHGDKPPAYEALSYVCTYQVTAPWKLTFDEGGNQDDPDVLSLDNTRWLITQNLHAALLALRHTTNDRVLWIDALAINQSEDFSAVTEFCAVAETSLTSAWSAEEGADLLQRSVSQ